MEFKHCPECGAKLVKKELDLDGMVPYCEECKSFRFPLYNVAVIMIVRNESNGKILLIKQYNRPTFILVAGYVNRGESIEAAVIREVKEETGLTVKRIKFNRTEFYERSDALMCNFTVFVEGDSEMAPNNEIDDFAWFDPEDAKREITDGSLAEKFLVKYLDEESVV